MVFMPSIMHTVKKKILFFILIFVFNLFGSFLYSNSFWIL